MSMDKATLIQAVLESPYLDESDWKFIDQVAVKLGLKDRHDYLNFRLSEFEGFIQDNIKPRLDGLNQENVSSFKEEFREKIASWGSSMDPAAVDFESKLHRLSGSDQDRLRNIDIRTQKSMLTALIKQDEPDKKGRRSFAIESIKHEFVLAGHRLENRQLYEELIDFLTSLENDPAERLIRLASQQFYYFKDKHAILISLHDKVLAQGLIEENPNFLTTFKSQFPDQQIITVWKSTRPSLLHLLYHLNSKKVYADGRPLYEIALRLFRLGNSSNQPELMRSAYNKWLKLKDDPLYLKRNMKVIEELFED